MKKILFILTVLFASFVSASCSDDDDDRTVKFSELPTEAQSFLKAHFGEVENGNINFSESDIRKVKVESNGEYDVHFVNGIEVDFYSNGIWKEIDLNGNQMPQSIMMLLPAKALEYVGTKYPAGVIEEIEKQGAYSETQGFKIELRGDRDIYFDYLGNVLKDKGESIGGNSQNIGVDALPANTKEFLSKYFGDISATPLVEKDWDKYEVTYYEDTANEIEIDFTLEGAFKSIELESTNNIIRTIITDVSKTGNLLQYVDANFSDYFIEKFSVINTAILGAELKDGYSISVEKGKEEWKIFFKSDGSFYRTVND